MALGNLRLTCGTLLSGATYTRLREIFEFSGIRIFSHTTFNKIQFSVVRPVVHEFWKANNKLVVEQAIRRGQTKVCGDGQCDSPGHTAKYGIYSIMNQVEGHILGHRLTQVSEAGNSNRMELFGFKKVLERLVEQGLAVSQVTTDRHVSVRKYITENCPNIKLQFDVWHLCKNIKKQLLKLAKLKPNADLIPWIKSICNHLWWCTANCGKNAQTLREMWTSVVHHITGKHSWTGSQNFHACSHKPYTKAEHDETAWLKPGNTAHTALQKVIFDASILRDLPFLTEFSHTGCIEVYHALRNKYAPKRLHFSYEGLSLRSELAILDHNTSVNLEQAKTKSGEDRYKLSYTKITKQWVVKPIKQKKNKKIFHAIVARAEALVKSGKKLEVPQKPNLPPNIAPTPKPDKKEAIRKHKSRFL